ncbi:MAG: Ig-like domain-containing protein [Candidatus Muiribacteriota bacterium]
MKKFLLTTLLSILLVFNINALKLEFYPTPDMQVEKDTSIFIKFEKDMNPEYLNRFTFVLNDGQADIRGQVLYKPEEKKAYFIPVTHLKEGQIYKATLYKGVKALDNTELESTISWNFRISQHSMVIATLDDFKETMEQYKPKREFLTILETSPQPGTIVDRTAPVVIKFSAPIDNSTVNKYTFMVKSETKKTEGRIEIRDNRLTFLPFEPFELNSRYTVIATNFIRDINGFSLQETFELNFQTDSLSKDEFPKIIEHYPGQNDINVSPGSSIIVKFNKNMDPSTLNRFNIVLHNGLKNTWGNISYNQKEKILVFEPEEDLPSNMKCSFRIRKNVRDTEGKFLNEDFVLEFITGTEKTALIHDKEQKPTLPDEPEKVDESSYTERYLMKSDNMFFLKDYFPKDRETKIKTDSSIKIDFSREARENTVNQFSIVVTDGVRNVWGDVVYDSKALTAWFTPKEPLRHNTLYYIRVSDEIKDINGNNLDRYYEWSFITEPLPDRVPPEITEVYPGDREINVGSDVIIKARFNEEIRVESLNMFTVRLSDGTGNKKTDITYDKEQNIAFIRPLERLKMNTLYKVILGPAISDLAGNFMKEEVSFTFWCGNPPDVTPPMILGISPRENAPVYTTRPIVSVTFNEPVDTVSLTPFNFGLLDENNKPVPGIIEYSPVTFRAIYKYLEPLQFGKIYRVFVGTGIKDVSGNNFEQNILWEFIISHPEETLPVIIASYPHQNNTNFNSDSDLFIQFNKDMNPASFNRFTIKLKDMTDKYYMGEIVYEKDKRELVFKPYTRLPFNTKLILEISRFIQDTEGKNMAEDYSLVFYTEGRGHAEQN